MNRRLLLTGMNGTLAPHVATALRATGNEVIAWDRDSASPDDPDAVRDFLERSACTGILHLAMGSERWAADLAAFCADRDLPFVFTSTAMVFDHEPDGPHHESDLRSAKDDYGRYKIRCEDTVLAANPSAIVARIGYQIDPVRALGNNMIAHLDAQAASGGIRASRCWIPACSFMPDTAQALSWLLHHATDDGIAGVHHLDANAHDAWDYHRLVLAQRDVLGRDWSVEVDESYRHDQRLLCSRNAIHRFALPSLSVRLSR